MAEARTVHRKIQDLFDSRIRSLQTMTLGIVREINSDGTYNVEIKIQDKRTPNEIVRDIPVFYLKGGDSVIRPSISVGDIVLLGFTKWPLNPYYKDSETAVISINQFKPFRDYAFIFGTIGKQVSSNDKTFKVDGSNYQFIYISAENMYSSVLTHEMVSASELSGWLLPVGTDKLYGKWLWPENTKQGVNAQIYIEVAIGSSVPSTLILTYDYKKLVSGVFSPGTDGTAQITFNVPNNPLAPKIYRIGPLSRGTDVLKTEAFSIARSGTCASGVYVTGVIIKYPIDQLFYNDAQGVVL